MKEEFVTYEQALALKELGFDEICIGAYFHPNLSEMKYPQYFNSNTGLMMDVDSCTAPLKQQVFRWFREKHNILGVVYSNASGYLYEWHDNIGGTHRGWSEYEGPNDSGVWDTYEEAEDACIDKLIEKLIN